MSATETTQAPDALRPVSCAHEAYQGQCAHCGVPIVNGFPKYPAVQSAAGREEIARALDLLNEARNGGFFIGTDAGAKVEEAKDVLRDILAAISTPAQASGEPVAWRFRRSAEATAPFPPPDHWEYGAEPIKGEAPGYYEIQPLYAQASETGGEMIGHITQALVRADEEFGNSLSAYRYRKLAEAVAALSAPQAAPGEGEQS